VIQRYERYNMEIAQFYFLYPVTEENHDQTENSKLRGPKPGLLEHNQWGACRTRRRGNVSN